MMQSAKSEDPRPNSCELFSKYSNLYVITIPQRYRQTDGQTNDLSWQHRALRSIARFTTLMRKFDTIMTSIGGTY